MLEVDDLVVATARARLCTASTLPSRKAWPSWAATAWARPRCSRPDRHAAANRGTVRVAGADVSKDESYRRVSKGIAYVPQGRMIFPTLTVEENIQTGLENAQSQRVPDELYAPVLFDMRRRKGGNLSGGQQQQRDRARATDPKVLLLDEPTEGIQPSVIKDIATALNEIRTSAISPSSCRSRC
jgi:ABC-type branched-subunit amino acid transport system ATPase component